jgi:hypothetical protein
MASFASLETPRSLWSRAPSTARRSSAAAAAAASYDSVNSAPKEALLILVRPQKHISNAMHRASAGDTRTRDVYDTSCRWHRAMC